MEREVYQSVSRLRGREDRPEELPLGADSSREWRRGVKSWNQVDSADPRIHLHFGSETTTTSALSLAVGLFDTPIYTYIRRFQMCCDLRGLKEENPPVSGLQTEDVRLLCVISCLLGQRVVHAHHLLVSRLVSPVIILTYTQITGEITEIYL